MEPVDLAIVCLIVLIALIYYFVRRHRETSLSQKSSQARGKKQKTMEFLEERGYKILEWESSIEITSQIDTKTYTDVVEVDFIVEKDNKRYLVKTASGGQSSRLGYRENREPLTALMSIFSCPNLLFVDTEKNNIRVMETVIGKSVASKLQGLVKAGPIFLAGVLFAVILWYLMDLVN